MKNISIFILTVLLTFVAHSQRTMEWSIGEVKVTCGETVKISYPLMVSISDGSGVPILATSTIRLFYDANKFQKLNIVNIENGYSASTLKASNPVFGDIFGFPHAEGVFVQFDILDNASINPLILSTTPTHVLDFSFEVKPSAKYPICTPIVFDNNKNDNKGANFDSGYLPNDSGIVGGYFINKDRRNIIAADDEVINFSWEKSKDFKGKLNKKNKIKVGKFKETYCVENICVINDCDDDGIPDSNEIDSNGNGTPDDCEKKNNHGNNGVAKNYDLFSVYPVPYDYEVFIKYEFDYDTNVTIEILDTKGALIRKIENRNYVKGTFYEQRADLSRVDSQLLFVRLTTNKGFSTKKIVSSSIKQKE